MVHLDNIKFFQNNYYYIPFVITLSIIFTFIVIKVKFM